MQRKQFPLKKCRLFWGLAVSDASVEPIQTALCDQYPELKKAKWTQPGNFHITISFLGDVAQDQLERIIDAVASENWSIDAFGISLRRVSRFPADESKIIAANLQLTESLAQIYQGVKAAMEPITSFRDKHPFRPHITLCRIPFEQCKRFEPVEFELSLTFSELILFQSRQVSKGSVYLPMYRLAFKP